MNESLEKAGTPQALILQAIDKGLSIEHLEKLMGLQERWQANQARIAFFESMSKFQNDCPVLEKKKSVNYNTTHYKYAPLGEISATIKDALRNNGLSYRWEMNDKDESIECTCIVSHKDGHSERSTMSARKDSSGNKNEIQSRGSTITYLQRYTLIAALGISTADEDNDAQPSSANNSLSEYEAPVKKSEKNEISFAVFDPKVEKITFGKYKGLEWIALERGYLGWILENGQPDARQKAKLTLEYVDNLKSQSETGIDPLESVFGKKDEKSKEPPVTMQAPAIDVLLSSLDEVILKNDNEELTKWWKENNETINKLGKMDKSIITKAFNHAKVKGK